MDLKSNVRRVMSNLSNISINTQDSFLIFGKYCIINVKYKKEYLSDKKRKNKKSEIQKNLKGSLRFKIFADRLPTGVYQLVKIPVTYFVKITNERWNDFYYGRKGRSDHISDSESHSDVDVNGE